MSDANGSTSTPRKCTLYSRRSAGGRIRVVVYLETELALYADQFCQANGQSMSSLFNELVVMLRDEV